MLFFTIGLPIILVIISFNLKGVKGLVFQLMLLAINAVTPDKTFFIGETLQVISILRNIVRILKVYIFINRVIDAIKNFVTKYKKVIIGVLVVLAAFAIWWLFFDNM